MSVIKALRRLRQKDQKFEVILAYREILSQKKKKFKLLEVHPTKQLWNYETK
jgi:hypothetical protein